MSINKEGKQDFLKHWAVIRKWAMYNYDIKLGTDLDVILFLYSEKVFTKTTLIEYTKFMPWDRHRFKRLVDNGFIVLFRERKSSMRTLYELSFASKKMVASIYRKLNGLEPIPMSPRRSSVFKPNATFAEKTLALAIKRINSEFRSRKQCPSPE